VERGVEPVLGQRARPAHFRLKKIMGRAEEVKGLARAPNVVKKLNREAGD